MEWRRCRHIHATQLIYEVFKLLNTYNYYASHTAFTKTYITSIKDNISTDLCREVLENSVKVSE